MIECKCCDKPVKTNRNLNNQKYCSERCAQMYKSGTVTIGKLNVQKSFFDRFLLRNTIAQAERDGHEYVTVSFND
jgi:hypothetical protein